MKQLYFITVIIGLVFFKTSTAFCQPEPSYNGKTVSEWVADLSGKMPATTRNEAEAALQKIGTNALPFLLQETRTLGEAWNKDIVNFYNTTNNMTDRQMNARHAFRVLGSIGKPAIPTLVDLMNHGLLADSAAYDLTQIDPQAAVEALTQTLSNTNELIFVRCAVANNLFEVRSNADLAVPALIEALKFQSADPKSAQVRYCAAKALGFIGKNPEKAVPALIEALQQDQNAIVRLHAAQALGRFGKDATAAIPALTQATKDTDSHVSLAATAILKKIQSP